MQFDFLAFLVVFVFKLVVILLLVVQGSKTYLPMTPLDGIFSRILIVWGLTFKSFFCFEFTLVFGERM